MQSEHASKDSARDNEHIRESFLGQGNYAPCVCVEGGGGGGHSASCNTVREGD